MISNDDSLLWVKVPSFTQSAALPQAKLCTRRVISLQQIILLQQNNRGDSAVLQCGACTPGEPEAPAPRCALPSWPQEKLSPAVAKKLGCIQLLPAAPSKLLEGHALPGFMLEFEHSENTVWFHSTCQELGVVTSVRSATCAAAGMARLPVPAIKGSSCCRTRPRTLTDHLLWCKQMSPCSRAATRMLKQLVLPLHKDVIFVPRS